MMNPIGMDEYRKVRQRELEAEIQQNRLARLVSDKPGWSIKPSLIVSLGSLLLGALIVTQVFIG